MSIAGKWVNCTVRCSTYVSIKWAETHFDRHEIHLAIDENMDSKHWYTDTSKRTQRWVHVMYTYHYKYVVASLWTKMLMVSSKSNLRCHPSICIECDCVCVWCIEQYNFCHCCCSFIHVFSIFNSHTERWRGTNITCAKAVAPGELTSECDVM